MVTILPAFQVSFFNGEEQPSGFALRPEDTGDCLLRSHRAGTVPKLSSVMLMGLGGLGMGYIKRRKSSDVA